MFRFLLACTAMSLTVFSSVHAIESDRDLCLFAYKIMAEDNTRLGSDWEDALLSQDYVANAEEMFKRFGSYKLPQEDFRLLLNSPEDFRIVNYDVETRTLEELLLVLAAHDGVATWRENGAPVFLVSKEGEPEVAFSSGPVQLSAETVTHEKNHLDVWARWKGRLMKEGLSAEDAGRKAFFVMSSPLGRFFAEHSAVGEENKLRLKTVAGYKTLSGINDVSNFVEIVISRNLYPAEAAWNTAERLKRMLENVDEKSSSDRQNILALAKIQKELAYRIVEDTKYMREQLAQKHEALAKKGDDAGKQFHREWAKRLRTPPTLSQYYLGDKHNNLNSDELRPVLFEAIEQAHRSVWNAPIVK